MIAKRESAARLLAAQVDPGVLGATDTSVSFEKLRDLSKIHDKAALADADPQFSAKIREGVPVPR
jgi:hypothetical protein